MKKIKILISTLLISSLLTLPGISKSKTNSYKDLINRDPDSNYVFLFVHRSAAFLDWSNPSDLAKTNIYSILAKKFQGPEASTIGHAQIGWHCNNGKGKVISGATGQTGQNNGQGLDYILKGWGLTILDIVYQDGELETEQMIEDKIKLTDKFNNFAWTAFKVDNQSCMKMADYVSKYRESGAAKNYGFPVEPLKYEGAGCTSFANAALSLVDPKLSELSKGWVRHVKLPEQYMGRLEKSEPNSKSYTLAKNKDDVKKVPMTQFLFGTTEWAKDNEPYKDFYYYDPELFYESLVHLENKYRKKAGMSLRNPLRTKSYDEFQTKTKNISEQWFEKMWNDYKRVKIGKIYNTSGLIIDLE